MKKDTAHRDKMIAELVSKYKLSVVEGFEIPDTAVFDTQDMATANEVIKKPSHFSFRIAQRQYTAPASTVKWLQRVTIERANNEDDDTPSLRIQDIVFDDAFCLMTDREELDAEMYHWGHQVYMASYNNDDMPEFNVIVHVSRYSEEGKWEIRNYLAGVDIDSEYVQMTHIRNSPAPLP